MHVVAFVVVLALLEYSILGAMVGERGVKYKVPAPATTGDPIFERYFRVHQNYDGTAGRVRSRDVHLRDLRSYARPPRLVSYSSWRASIYAMATSATPEKREGGAIATFLVNTILVLGSLIGVGPRPSSSSSIPLACGPPDETECGAVKFACLTQLRPSG